MIRIAFMNKTEWKDCNSPWKMLEFIEARACDRKLQLFVVACCRRALFVGADPLNHELIERTERFADGLLSTKEFCNFRNEVKKLLTDNSDADPEDRSHFLTVAILNAKGGGSAKFASRIAARSIAGLTNARRSEQCFSSLRDEEIHQCDLLRDIFGDPNRPFRFDPVWLSNMASDSRKLAREIYDTGCFENITLLANILERDGCHDQMVLEHCRSPGPHVRGCWVVDALIGHESAVRSGLITEADWRDCRVPTTLLYFLRDKGTIRKWREFAVACCRRISHWMTDDRSLWAIEVAARHAEGIATDKALEEARSEAQAAQEAAKDSEWEAEVDENFCLTPRYAAISRSLFAAQAARSAVCRDPRSTDAQPGTIEAELWQPSHFWAAAAVRWNVYAEARGSIEGFDDEDELSIDISLLMNEHGKIGSSLPCMGIKNEGKRARDIELYAQCKILHELFGEVLGPPGDVGAWLPCGDADRRSEWWCFLPTPQIVDIRPEWLEWSDRAIPRT